MNTPSIFAECRELSAAIRQKRGSLVGVACKAGLFCVTETRKENGRSVTVELTGMQSHAECVDHMRALAA